jgi:hypothetical protein
MRTLIPVLGLILVGAGVGRPALAQEPADSVADRVVFEGTFRSVAGHQAGGDYQILQRQGRWVVRMTESFTTEKVPDGHVYLSNHPEALGRDAYHVNRLIRRNGVQEYLLPEDIDPTAFKFLLVWCVRFDVGVAAGPLET